MPLMDRRSFPPQGIICVQFDLAGLHSAVLVQNGAICSEFIGALPKTIITNVKSFFFSFLFRSGTPAAGSMCISSKNLKEIKDYWCIHVDALSHYRNGRVDVWSFHT